MYRKGRRIPGWWWRVWDRIITTLSLQFPILSLLLSRILKSMMPPQNWHKINIIQFLNVKYLVEESYSNWKRYSILKGWWPCFFMLYLFFLNSKRKTTTTTTLPPPWLKYPLLQVTSPVLTSFASFLSSRLSSPRSWGEGVYSSAAARTHPDHWWPPLLTSRLAL